MSVVDRGAEPNGSKDGVDFFKPGKRKRLRNICDESKF